VALKNDDGFTILEVVISIALFAIIASAATFAIVSSIRASNATELRIEATHVAQEQLDLVRALGASPAASPPLSSDDEALYSVGITWTAACSASVRSRDVAVTVSVKGSSISPVILGTRLACGIV
jgi:prepilin-type N-terminal cleavage/methylation domain-containing protein